MLLGYSFEPRPNSRVQKRVWQERTRLTSPEVRAAATSKVWRNRPFPSSENLTFKVRLSPKPLIWKWFLIMMQIKLIFTTKVSHLASFWKWDFLELGNGLFRWSLLFSSSLKKRIGGLCWQGSRTYTELKMSTQKSRTLISVKALWNSLSNRQNIFPFLIG